MIDKLINKHMVSFTTGHTCIWMAFRPILRDISKFLPSIACKQENPKKTVLKVCSRTLILVLVMSYDFSLVVEFNFDVTDSNLFVSQTSPSGPWVFEMFQLPQPCSVNKLFNSNLEFWLFQVAQLKQVVTRKKLWKIELDLEKKHSPLPLTEPAPFGVTRRNPPSMSSSATLNVFPQFYCDFRI